MEKFFLQKGAASWGRRDEVSQPVFENFKKLLDLGEKCHDCVHLWVKFPIYNTFMRFRWKVRWNSLIPRNSTSPEKFLVVPLLYFCTLYMRKADCTKKRVFFDKDIEDNAFNLKRFVYVIIILFLIWSIWISL